MIVDCINHDSVSNVGLNNDGKSALLHIKDKFHQPQHSIFSDIRTSIPHPQFGSSSPLFNRTYKRQAQNVRRNPAEFWTAQYLDTPPPPPPVAPACRDGFNSLRHCVNGSMMS